MAVRVISRLFGIAVGFVVYAKYGIWVAIAAGLGAWFLIVVAFGILYSHMRPDDFIAMSRDTDQTRKPE